MGRAGCVRARGWGDGLLSSSAVGRGLPEPDPACAYQPGWSRGDGFFATLAVGGAIHDGKLDTTDPKRKSLGSRILFREGVDLGYRFNEHISVSAFVDHISNANLAHRNEGLTNGGMRLGYRF